MTKNNLTPECRKLSNRIRREQKAESDFIASLEITFRKNNKNEIGLFVLNRSEDGDDDTFSPVGSYYEAIEKGEKYAVVVAECAFGNALKRNNRIYVWQPVTEQGYFYLLENKHDFLESQKKIFRYDAYRNAVKNGVVKRITTYAANEIKAAFDRAAEIDDAELQPPQ